MLEGERFEHVFDETGEYVVTLTLEDAEGNSARETFTVTVEGNPWPYIALLLILVIGGILAILYLRGGKKGD